MPDADLSEIMEEQPDYAPLPNSQQQSKPLPARLPHLVSHQSSSQTSLSKKMSNSTQELNKAAASAYCAPKPQTAYSQMAMKNRTFYGSTFLPNKSVKNTHVIPATTIKLKESALPPLKAVPKAVKLPPLPPDVLQKSQSNPMFKTFSNFNFEPAGVGGRASPQVIKTSRGEPKRDEIVTLKPYQSPLGKAKHSVDQK